MDEATRLARQQAKCTSCDHAWNTHRLADTLPIGHQECTEPGCSCTGFTGGAREVSGQLGDVIDAIRAALEEAERRAPLELAGRIASHGPMRDERELAGVYCELVALLHVLFMPPDAPAAPCL